MLLEVGALFRSVLVGSVTVVAFGKASTAYSPLLLHILRRCCCLFSGPETPALLLLILRYCCIFSGLSGAIAAYSPLMVATAADTDSMTAGIAVASNFFEEETLSGTGAVPLAQPVPDPGTPGSLSGEGANGTHYIVSSFCI